MDPEQRSERSGIHSPRGREADPHDERRRIHFAAAEDASGGRGGHEVERSETSVSPAFTTRREASHLLAKGGPGGCAASTPQLDEGRSGIHSPRGREADPRDERRRIQFAAAEDASGGRGGHEVERSETSVSPAFTT